MPVRFSSPGAAFSTAPGRLNPHSASSPITAAACQNAPEEYRAVVKSTAETMRGLANNWPGIRSIPAFLNPSVPLHLANGLMHQFAPKVPDGDLRQSLDVYAPSGATKLQRVRDAQAYFPPKECLNVVGQFLVRRLETAHPGEKFEFETTHNWLLGNDTLKIYRHRNEEPVVHNLWGALARSEILSISPHEDFYSQDLRITVRDSKYKATTYAALNASEGFVRGHSNFRQGFVDSENGALSPIKTAAADDLFPDAETIPVRDVPNVLALAVQTFLSREPEADSALPGSERVTTGLEAMATPEAKLSRTECLRIVGGFLVAKFREMHPNEVYDYGVFRNFLDQDELRLFKRETGAPAPDNLWGIFGKTDIIKLTTDGDAWDFYRETLHNEDALALWARHADAILSFMREHSDLDRDTPPMYQGNR